MTIFRLGRCCVVLCLLLILPAFSVLAQQHLSIQSLIDSARKNIPLLKQKLALIKAAKASVTEVKHSFLPQVKFSEQLNVGSDNSLAGSFFTFGITPSTSAGVRAENTLDPVTGNVGVLYSEYELANFGLNKAKLLYAEASVDLQQADFERDNYSIAVQVAKLYFNILKNQYKLEADKQNIERYGNIFTVIKALTVSGINPGADSSLAKAELSKTRIIYNQTLGTINQLKEQMSFFTGISARQLVIENAAIDSIHSMPVFIPFVMDTLHNPLIDYYIKKRDLLSTNGQLIRKTYLPKIILAGSAWARGSSIQYNDQFKSLGTGIGYQRFNYAAGVAFTYSLFNSIYRKDKLAINRYQISAGEYELEQQKQSLYAALKQANNALQTTRENLLELPVQLQSAQDTYNQKTAQYKAGIISLIDLTNASFVLYRSQTDYIETLSDWYLAQLDQAAATGNLSSFIQTIK